MGDYNIDINVNMGGSQGNFQTLIDSVNNLNASFQKVGTSATAAGKGSSRAFSETSRIMKVYENDVKAVSAKIDEYRQKIKEQGVALKQGTIIQTEHDKAVTRYAAKIKTLTDAQRQYNTVLGQTTTQTRAANTGVNQLSASFNKLGAVLGVSFGLYGIFRLLQGGVKTIAEFELSQKKLQSVLGESAEGMKVLTDAAIKLGRASIFGAKGVSELQIELAKMGFRKQEIIDMQKAIMNLATATQEDLASSTEVVANVLRSYGLEATEATRITDVMGNSFNQSALNLENFREAIKYVGPVARQAGFSFEETVAALELLANAGLKGSLAGTGLNNVLKAMMDANSKLSKSLGGTVKGFDGFMSVLEKARKEGWDTEKIFGLITQRATSAFTILKNGTEDIYRFRDANLEAADVLENQVAVQMDTVTNQAKLLKEGFKALWLELDEGEIPIAKVLKGLLMLGRALFGITDKQKNSLADEMDIVQGKAAEFHDFVAKMELGDELRREVQAAVNGFDEYIKGLRTKSDFWYIENEAQIAKRMTAANATFEKVIDAQAKKTALYYDLFIKQTGSAEKGYSKFVDSITEERSKVEENTLKYKAYSRALEMVAKRHNSITEAKDKSLSGAELKKAIQERYKYELSLLKAQQKIEDEKIKMLDNEYYKSIKLAESKAKFSKLIAEKELERDIALGGDRKKLMILNNKELLAIQLNYSNALIDIFKDANKKVADNEAKMLKKNFKLRTEYSKDFVKDWEKRMKDIDKSMKDFKFDSPILAKIFGQDIEEGLFAGLIEDKDIDNFAKAFDTAFDSIGKSINSYVDSWVDATDRIVDQLNRQVDEMQNAINIELADRAAGYASNVTLKRKELEELKRVREEALKDQQEAQQAQVAADTITQLSSMITSASQIFKGVTKVMPIIGVPIAIGLIATMFGAFAAAKAKAFQTAGVNKFEEGGWVGGRRHSQGGTHIEAERDEFIIKRSSALKHRGLVEAINADNQYEMNRIYLNKMKGQIIHSRVSLDDSKDLKAIRSLMEKTSKTIEYSGRYRIEKVGNTTTKIRLS